MRIFALLAVLLLAYNVLPALLSTIYADHGRGDQHLVFWVVFGAFATPALWPVLQFKTLVLNVLLPAANLGWLEGKLTYAIGRAVLTPAEPFHPSKVPPKPDYHNEAYWSMLPDRKASPRPDASHNVVGDPSDFLEKKICSAFYLHPSTWYTSISWNADPLHPVTSYLSDDAIGPQHANAFNHACRIFAPRFRQMAAAGFLQEKGLDDENSRQALEVAYSDVKEAFEHFLKHHHKGEPIILTGHSQGSLHAARLLKEFFERDDLHPYLGAAYLPGWTFFEDDFTGKVKPCSDPEQVGCIAAWRTFAAGGDHTAFLYIPPKSEKSKPICTNPLSWTADEKHVPESANRGGLDVMHYTSMWRYMVGYKTPAERVRPPPLIPNITDAQCVGGNLLITPPKHWGYGWGIWPFPAWTFASFPGQNLHTYDFNFFFGNVRENVLRRMKAWHKLRSKA